MTIQQFINQIPFVILQRGQDYFENGYIHELNEGRNGTWYAEVEGNYGDYEVEIEIDKKGNVSNYYCNCPYDGAICKHIAAVALEINERKTIRIPPEQEPKEDSWKQLIQNTKPDDLRNFMLDFGLKNQDFRHQVKLAFSKPASVQNANNIVYYQNQITGIFENYDYQGFIDYHNSYKAMRDVDHFLSKADDYYNKGNLNEVFCIAAAIAMEAVKAIQYMDDSSGECGGAICESFQIIENVLNNTNSEELKKKIFDWLYQQVQNPEYNDYGVGDNLEPLFFETAITLNERDLAYNFIDNKIIQLDNQDSWSKKYYMQSYLSQKINLLQSEGRNDEADQIINQNLHLEEFRKIRVEQAMAVNNYTNAEKLILEGIKIAELDKLPGVIHQWKDQLLELYKLQKDNSKYNKLARELFVENSSNIKYFRIYKQTTPSETWEEQRNRLIAELKNIKRGYYRGTPLDDLAHIYIEEQMLDDLFELVSSSNSIHTIIKYTPHLKSKYAADLIEYYKAAIEIEAENTGRNVYVALVQYLKKMATLKGGLNTAKALKESLLNKYKNRPAMKEEFKKLNWD